MSSDWDVINLGNACTKVGSGATPRGGKAVYLDDGPVALIRSQNVHNDRFITDGLAYITNVQAALLSNVIVEPNDVLLNITGDSVARCSQVDPSVLPARVNQHVAIIRPNNKCLDPRFLRYYLVAPEVQQYLLQLASAGATRPALTKAMIESLSIKAPIRVSDQRAIADILTALDHKIELNRKMSATLEDMARALFKSWFVNYDPVRAKAEGRDTGLPPEISALFPDSFMDSQCGEIPKGWEILPLGDLLSLEYGKPLKAENRQEGLVPVFGSNGIVGWHNDAFVRGPGIVVGRKGNPGTIAWSETDFYPIDTSFYVVPKRELSMPFLFFSLAANDLKNLAADSAVPGLNRNQAYMSNQVLPAADPIKVFDSVVAPLNARVSAAGRESRSLADLRDALLPKLISGELRVKRLRI